jgi:glycosyltransferase involved in cell wall biosynthesis
VAEAAPPPPGLLSVVLPVHDQADHIAEAVRGFETALDRLSILHETILVTNACVDGSVAICRTLTEDLPCVRTVDIQQAGWGRAVRRGLAEARGETLCYTNSARTSPEDLTLLVLYAKAFPHAVVKASRKIRESVRRRFGSLLYNLECRMLFDLPCWDINGTPKVFSRHFHQLLTLRRDDDLIDLEFVATCRRLGYPLLDVPILSARRRGGRSTTGYRTAVRLYLGAWQLRRTWGRPAA